ncbi:alpha/beta fold hydrolase [Microbacterium sp. 2FI]|uniref:alpha/beta hydrolase n=1 Tax=Microbacterium sp. 2FI TaxID=2502193 RepID=UPI00148590B8|nr:alpha/beta fold hydrolase [Microbacterium sp. 2FI]
MPTTERGLPKLIHLTRLMLYGDRQPMERSPADVGLAFEEVSFSSTDDIALRGWFIPAGTDVGPVVMFVHGWLWTRLGNTADRVPFHDAEVDFLPATRALHDAGFHVLLFDLSNHGESGTRHPLTYGRWEARDVIGAIDYLRGRRDVDPARISAVGTSAGANTVMYAIPDAPPVKAFLAVQPTRLPVFNRRFAREVLGPLGPMEAGSMDLLYVFARAPLPSRHDPAVPARHLGDTVVQYVQGTGDPWGEMAIVEEFSALTPHSLGVTRFPSTGRYEGYQYVSARVDEIVDFFIAHG